MKNGKSVIIDATFSSIRARNQLRAQICSLGAQINFIEITSSDETIKNRLRARDTSEEEVSDARLEDFQKLDDRYDPPNDSEGWSICSISSDVSVEETRFEILKHLVTRQLMGEPAEDMSRTTKP